jgi:hypothetical protein
MALALVCTMAAAVLFQPALMGRPREREAWEVRRVGPVPAVQPAQSRLIQPQYTRADKAFEPASEIERAHQYEPRA